MPPHLHPLLSGAAPWCRPPRCLPGSAGTKSENHPGACAPCPSATEGHETDIQDTLALVPPRRTLLRAPERDSHLLQEEGPPSLTRHSSLNNSKISRGNCSLPPDKLLCEAQTSRRNEESKAQGTEGLQESNGLSTQACQQHQPCPHPTMCTPSQPRTPFQPGPPRQRPQRPEKEGARERRGYTYLADQDKGME